MKYYLNKWLLLIFLISLSAIIVALIAEYVFDLTPCGMCLKQRHPYYFIIIASLIGYLFKKLQYGLLPILNQLAVLYGLFYSIWHVGIEKKIFQGPSSCSGTLSKTNSIQNLKDQISNQEIINCSDITWVIFGLSAATINSILLLFILIINSIYIIEIYYGSKKK